MSAAPAWWAKEVHLPTGGNKDRYFKATVGEHRIRILSEPIFGWEDWLDNKPLRSRYHEKPERPVVEAKPVKLFVAFIIWDYASKAVKIYSITQVSIQKDLRTLSYDKEWGDPRNYDIKIVRKGEGKTTEYTTTPCPPKKVDDAVLNAFAQDKIDLNLLFEGSDPFNSALSGLEVPDDAEMCIDLNELDELANYLTKDPEAQLKICQTLSIDGVADMKKSDFKRMIKWLKTRAHAQSK